MHVERLIVGMFQSNCYLLSCERTGEAIIIDAGDEGERILSLVESRNLNIKAIVNTHAHIDHVSALSEVAPALAAPVMMHKGDLEIYDNLAAQAATFGMSAPRNIKIERFLEEGDKIEFGDVSCEVIHTPGHSPGGISIICRDDKPQKIFSGDTLFMGSIGRIDLHGGDFETIIRSLQDKYLPLPDDTIVYPGHGGDTTIGTEKRHNPFLSQLV